MEPTMAPMMMLVTVIPETEEERAAKSVLKTDERRLSRQSHEHEGIHKQSAAGHGIQQEKSSRRIREEGTGDKHAAVTPSAWLWRGVVGSYSGEQSNNIQKELIWDEVWVRERSRETNKHNEKELKSDLKSLRQRHQPINKEWVWK